MEEDITVYCERIDCKCVNNVCKSGLENGENIDETFCDYKLKGAKGCVGKKVQVKGEISTDVGQHMMEEPAEETGYLDTDFGVFGQIQLFTKEEMNCQEGNEVLVSGRLELIGTCDESEEIHHDGKISYCNYGIYVEDWECKEY